MIKDNQIFFNRLHIVLDAVVVTASYACAWAIKFLSPWSDTTPGETALSAETYFSFLYFLVPAHLLLYSIYNLYSSKRSNRFRTEVYGIFRANTVGIVGVMVSFFLLSTSVAGVIDFSRSFIFMFYLLNMLMMILSRSPFLPMTHWKIAFSYSSRLTSLSITSSPALYPCRKGMVSFRVVLSEHEP